MKKALLALALVFAAGSLSAAEIVEAIVVRVGDRIVTRTQYVRRLQEGITEIEQTAPLGEAETRKAEFKKNLINEIVSELLLKDRADRLALTVTAEDLQGAVARLKQQYGITTDEQFNESLQKSGMTRADMEARLRDSILMNKVFGRELRSREDLSDRELRERFDREKERYRLPERAHLREIVILRPEDPAAIEPARQRAQAAAEQARTAADFSVLAATASEAGTRSKGGDLGDVVRGELLPDLDKAVFNAQAGAVIGPIESKSGWHILKVENRLPSEIPAFESIKERLRREASEDAWQRDYKAYVDNLRKDAFIQIHEANVPST